VKIRFLPSALSCPELQFLTTFVINDTVAIDAGALGLWSDPTAQSSVGHVFLSHSHTDHVCSLPIFVTNVLSLRSAPVTVHSHADVLDSLARDVFNGRVWPNFLQLVHHGAPVLVLGETREARPVCVDGLVVTPVPVNHPVPTMAYLVDDGQAAVVISTDSGPTHDIWRLAARVANLKAVFLGVSYPDEEAELAHVAGHLTPSLVREEIDKMPADTQVIAVHIKPNYHARVIRQLQGLAWDRLSIGESGRVYVV
jgi:ribonuclease BN (tRNA processing enzyme)